MIADINKQHRRAFELTEVWDRFFPSLKGRAPIEFWMVQLEDFTINTLGQAIKNLARKRLTHDMPLSEMLAYIPQISKVIAADRVRLGLEQKAQTVPATNLPSPLSQQNFDRVLRPEDGEQ